ncbi:MAG: Uncharacterized protein G01um10143_255 [Parcubacteria group bacterium Gr01-1014_3]|nr:MAG: Uncharacterized protein G01um10143_255 [Parcubacteria group bacterium Gr01-1014_3]
MFSFFKNIYHYTLALLGSIFYGRPSRKLFVIGVTGTKGKSTTAELINAILEAAGKKTALISSVRFKVGDESVKNATSMTMPGRFFIQSLLRRAVNKGCEYAIIEVTSQGTLQHRHRFIDWDAAMFLNLHKEHIEAHGSFDKYRNAKLEFFRYAAKDSRKAKKLFIINEEDPAREYFANLVAGAGRTIYFSREDFIEKKLDNGRDSVSDWIGNSFNLENAAAATAFAESQGIGWDKIHKTLENFKGVPGRMEIIQTEPFRVIVDYAHTPDSLEKLYRGLSEDKNKTKKLICVLGAAGGGRDKWKRPVMGESAARYCREIFLTNEDPYDEDPEQILADIKSGVLNSKFPISNLHVVLDRREAIHKAIRSAKKGDTVIITGKGSESWLHIAGGKAIPWDERGIVEEELK